MVYFIKTSRQFEKDFAALDPITQSRILIVLERMKQSPFVNAKKLKNIDVGIYRVRIGDYRLRFDVMNKEIYLYRIRHRKDVYK